MNALNALAAERAAFQSLADEHVAPHAAAIDSEEHIPRALVERLASAGCFASGFPAKHGGSDTSDRSQSAIQHGLLHEALGRASASVQGLVNVHHMGGSPILRWGSREQRAYWAPRLTSGEALAAIAITEPNVGSDASAVETRATRDGAGWRLDGVKRWITCGQTADVFTVLAGTDEGLTAFVVPRETEGFTATPIRGIHGCRGYMLAELRFDNCPLAGDQMLGRPAFGLSHVVNVGLDNGRYNLAWGCVGLAQAALEAAMTYAKERTQFGQPLAEHQLIQSKVSGMMVDTQAARLMCLHAGELRGARDPGAALQTTMAKYLASKVANRVAYQAQQIRGASGCGPQADVGRMVRDARIMEIIEGTSEVLELTIARYGFSGLK